MTTGPGASQTSANTRPANTDPASSSPSSTAGSPLSPAHPEGAEELPAHASAHLLSTSVNGLNRLRAGVLGCNDGMTSTAGLVVGVAAATSSTTGLVLAGLSGLVAGALSMGGGEYSSVQAQRDSQEALLRIQRAELETIPHEELDELAHLYMQRGLSLRVAREVAIELTAQDALAAHAEAELGIDISDLVSPWEASLASALSYLAGGALALLAILLPPTQVRIAVCVAVVLLGLAFTGYLAARLGSAPKGRATLRNLLVGGTTMAVTYVLGTVAHSLT
ncbi:MAG TPA: VIT family protein [Mycobacteriales bacterium]|nr:VIT family protein [Mycobacteriales bacterium]